MKALETLNLAKAGDVIAVCSKIHVDQTISLLATLFMGAILAPLDNELLVSDAVDILKDLRPVVAYCDPRTQGVIQQALVKSGVNCQIILFGKNLILYTIKILF